MGRNLNLILLIMALSFKSMLFSNNPYTITKTNTEKGLVKVHIETEINTSASHVWNILGRNFTEIDQWTAKITSSIPVGFDAVSVGFTASKMAPIAGRTTVSKKLTATEILTAYSDQDRTFTFKPTNGPNF